VLDVSAKWSRHQNDVAEGKKPKAKQPSQAEMLAMIKRVRGEQ
jgi:hypothetical protein